MKTDKNKKSSPVKAALKSVSHLEEKTKLFKMIDRTNFYNHIREHLFGHLSGLQVEGTEAILNEWEKRGLQDERWLAYMLATAYHETAKTMQPIEEYGKGRNRTYGIPDSRTGKIYYGRGFVQLTWRSNYEKLGHLLNTDLVNNPERALQPIVATQIMFEGMIRGLFTGRKLSDYFSDEREDWVMARKIINGIRKGEILPDRAQDIAGYAKQFYNALK